MSLSAPRTVLLTVAVAVLAAAAGWMAAGSACDPGVAAPVCPEVEAGRAATEAFLDENAGRYRETIGRARAWLDNLRVDPAELRAANLKGKKKLVELLDAYMRLLAIAAEEERAALLQRIEQVVALTYTDEYHDMLAVSDRQFKQDSTSYLRAAYLMETLGLDTARYRREIQKIHERLNGHMKSRGPHQRMAFDWYYRHFGLAQPFDLAAGFRGGVIANRLDPYEYRSNSRVYDLTHEIFVPYRFGEILEADFFSAEDLAYLRHTLEVLTSLYIMKRDPDLLAELISCIRYLKMTDLRVYRDGLHYLLSSQHQEGKWGRYERFRQRFGDLVEPGWYLHTTAVVIEALTTAFQFRKTATRELSNPTRSFRQ